MVRGRKLRGRKLKMVRGRKLRGRPLPSGAGRWNKVRNKEAAPREKDTICRAVLSENNPSVCILAIRTIRNSGSCIRGSHH